MAIQQHLVDALPQHLTPKNQKLFSTLVCNPTKTYWELLESVIRDASKSIGVRLFAITELLEHPAIEELTERPGDLTNLLDRDVVNIANFPKDMLTIAGNMLLIAIHNTHLSRENEDALPLIMRDYYNRCILQLLGKLPNGRLQEKLWNKYSLRDYLVFVAPGLKSGYDPFVQLMLDSRIPAEYKKIADEKIRVTILKECGLYRSGKFALPREQYEYAIMWYIQLLQAYARGGYRPYSFKLFASQVKFVRSLVQIRPKQASTRVQTIANALWVGFVEQPTA